MQLTWSCLDVGTLFRGLSREEPPEQEVFVDFENAQPTESEQETFLVIEKALEEAESILVDLRGYEGASAQIREAINHSSDPALQERAWNAVLPLVLRLKRYFEFSIQLEQVLPMSLWELCSGPLPPLEQLEQHQALAKQMAQLLDFVLTFDELKMSNPSIQNDFSFYRRTVNKMELNRQVHEDLEVGSDLANRMSLFYANTTPMLLTLSKIMSAFVSQNKELPIENTTDMLAAMAAVCRSTLEKPDLDQVFRSESTLRLCLRVMVGAVILYDHVHPVGAFAKNSSINIKAVIRVLRLQPPKVAENLLNALRYSTKHLKDESTPKQIKNALAATF